MSEENKKWQKMKEDSEQPEEIWEDEEEENPVEATPPKSALEHPNYAELETQLTLAEQKAHDNWEKAVRALAELDNVRRRAEKEVERTLLYGADKMIMALLPVMDSLEQGLQLSEKEGSAAMHEGLQLTMKLFLDALEKQGVKPLDPEGEPFNPQEHEAMSMQETKEAAPNTVLAVFQRGYKLHDRVIRPARVVVAKASQEKNPQ